MKIIEVLYSEISNMYGEIYNPMFLEKCNKDIKIIYTSLNDKPYFVNHNVDMIYMGNMRDSKISLALDKLMAYKDKIKDLIENDVIFMLTGNSLELFSQYILENNNNKIKGLGIFNYYIEKDMTKKHAGWVKGDFKNIELIGHRNQFSIMKENKKHFMNIVGGYGSDLVSNTEGVRYKNLYATYLLGPFLIMNPLFSEYLLKLMGLKMDKIIKENSMNAYNERINYFRQENARFKMTDHG